MSDSTKRSKCFYFMSEKEKKKKKKAVKHHLGSFVPHVKF